MINFKHERDRVLFTLLHPALQLIYLELAIHAKQEYDVDLVITQTVSTLELDQELGRVSSSHREFRALDIRTKNINAFITADLVQWINEHPQYKKYHYVSNSGVSRLAYWHIGTHEHIHLAIHSKYKANVKQYDVAHQYLTE